ncbi:hypothetical protein BH10PSE14_BH10PSE14_43100 [soil metagenome]
MSKAIWAILAVLAMWPLAAVAQDGAVPIYQPIEKFGSYGAQNVAPGDVLTADEVAKFEAAVAGMQRFPPYLYSGCHDRAEAAYRLLPAALQPKVGKIWVIGPARYTAAIGGTIHLRATDPASSKVDWGYHVALEIGTAAGMRVFDPALKPGVSMTRDEWFALMKLPSLAIWTTTAGDIYQFVYGTLDFAGLNGAQVWNGNANRYRYFDADHQIMPDNLARDAVGMDAIAGTTCQQLRDMATDPDALYAFLHQAVDVPAACAGSVDKFKRERARWSARLAG